ncbi:nucleotidyltransferase domain-containing protein [Kribbella sp. NPDC059898]|uniref:nucleotidyltransferase domain-containing protein n=1 Tax=Kribbella sp. NPDC059898 TaxID=3346995 RepID=UPI00365679B0
MHSPANDLDFVRQVVARLESAGIRTWLFGGWASELLGLSLPRPHNDIDLLYPADTFEAVDTFLATGRVDELAAKRFPHKRGFETDGIMVELFLVQPSESGPFTDFWGDIRYEWPSNVFDVQAGGLRIASALSLLAYRAAWDDLQPTVDGKRATSQEWLDHQTYAGPAALSRQRGE